MQDVREYLRAYWAYVSTSLGWKKSLTVALVWVVGMFAPLWIKTFAELPNWIGITWMFSWSLLSIVFAPYGMWKKQRAQNPGPIQPDRK